MTALAASLLASSIANTSHQYFGQRRAATAAEKQGEYQGRLADINASLADQDAADAIARGTLEAGRITRQGKLVAGSQRAALAASGVDVNVGSAADVQANDRMLSELDALTVQNNAARQAWGFQTQASTYRTQGAWARAAGRNQASTLRNQSYSTLLGGAFDLARTYQSMPKGVSGAGDIGEYGSSTYAGGMFGS